MLCAEMLGSSMSRVNEAKSKTSNEETQRPLQCEYDFGGCRELI